MASFEDFFARKYEELEEENARLSESLRASAGYAVTSDCKRGETS